MTFTLVIMAAGMGSRYGGLKQLEKFKDKTLLEYSIIEAGKVGCDKVICIIRPELQELFEKYIKVDVKITYVYQSIPADRNKPLGTGHAVWCAKEHISDYFVVINADDYYGINSFKLISEFISKANSTAALVGYKLGETLSVNGKVNRGICMEENGILISIQETSGLKRVGDHIIDKNKNIWLDDTYVSVNFWALPVSFLEYLNTSVNKFLSTTVVDEIMLPNIIQDWMNDKKIKIHLLPTNDKWFGITYPEDKDSIKNILNSFT